MATFAEMFCRHYRVAPKSYARSMFWRCLHRRAWPLVPMLRLISRDYFAADEALIRDLGRLTSEGGLNEDLADFYSHPRNVGFVRRRLRLRLSVARASRIVHRVFAEERDAAHPEAAEQAPREQTSG